MAMSGAYPTNLGSDEDDDLYSPSTENEVDMTEGEPESDTELEIDDLPNGNTREDGEQPEYTIQFNPNTNTIQLINTQSGQPQPISMAGLGMLRQLFGIGARDLTEEDEEDDDDGVWLPNADTTHSANHTLKPATLPTKAGIELERSGVFGKSHKLYSANRKYRIHQRCPSDIVRRRELARPGKRLSRTEIGDATVPNTHGVEVARFGIDSNVYNGQFTKDGSFFYTCSQDFKVRIFDMNSYMTPEKASVSDRRPTSRYGRMRYSDEHSSLPLIKTIHAEDHGSSWAITSADLSPDNRHIIWSTLGSTVGFAPLLNSENSMEGDGQTVLDFASGDSYRAMRFCIWSVKFSADAREIVAGSHGGSVHVYDLESRRTILSINAHRNDVNSVSWADTESSNVMVSGSDDSMLHVWDRRSLGSTSYERQARPSGTLVGHTEGVTNISAKGDGRYMLSNAKDQTCKLWDLRMMSSGRQESEPWYGKSYGIYGFDYRRAHYPKPRYAKHPYDKSVVTYSGHQVLRTLIRCYFSPEATTGQRYIYSGSSDGRVHIWNLDGTLNRILDRSRAKTMFNAQDQLVLPHESDIVEIPEVPTHRGPRVVRDVAWHPHQPIIFSSAWSNNAGGSVASHIYKSI